MKARLISSLVCAAALFCVGSASALDAPPAAKETSREAQVAPVERTPFHVPTFRNDKVAMLNVLLPAGRVAPYHRHSLDFVFVLVRESDFLVQNWGDPAPTPVRWPRAMVGFGAYSKKSLTHMVTNVGADPLRLVGFEFLSPAPSGFEISTRPAAYKQVTDNDRVRGWRVTLAPGETVPAFRQTAPGVRIVVEGGELVETVDGKGDQNMALQPGDFQWQDAGASRAIRNNGSATIDITEFELK